MDMGSAGVSRFANREEWAYVAFPRIDTGLEGVWVMAASGLWQKRQTYVYVGLWGPSRGRGRPG